MIEFGECLRKAREAKGYSIQQLADMTNMPPTRIADLEKENFSSIAAPIYGRGFVKLYCQAVGIDPKPLIEAFMDIYSGNREVAIKERPATTETSAEIEEDSTPPAAADTPEPPPEEVPPVVETSSLLDMPPPKMGNEPISAGDEPIYSRYAAPLRQNCAPAMPSYFWRVALVGAIAIALLWATAVGVRALYRATSVPISEEADASASYTAAETPAKTTPKTDGKAKKTTGKKREPQKIPPLYLD